MNKGALIDWIAKDTNMPKASCKSMIESFMRCVTSCLGKGETINLTGFGTFCMISRKARMGVNPSTGKQMEIKAKSVVRFRPGKNLKQVGN